MKKLSGKKTIWTTPGGEVSTSTKCQASFMIPELHSDRVIEWDLHVVTSGLGAYDMILGRDLLDDLEFVINFVSKMIDWDGASIPLKEVGNPDREAYYVPNPEQVESSTDRLKKILDAKYVPADLHKVVDSCDQLSDQQRRGLYEVM